MGAQKGLWGHRRGVRCLERRSCGQLCCICPAFMWGGKETSCLLNMEKQGCKVGTRTSQGCGLGLWLSFLCTLISALEKAVPLLRTLRRGFDVNSSSFFPFPVQWRRRRLTWRSPWRRTSTDGSWRKGQWRPGRSRMPLPSSGSWPYCDGALLWGFAFLTRNRCRHSLSHTRRSLSPA